MNNFAKGCLALHSAMIICCDKMRFGKPFEWKWLYESSKRWKETLHLKALDFPFTSILKK